MQLLKDEHLLLFLPFKTVNEESLDYGLLVGQKKQLKMALWALGYYDKHFSKRSS